MILRCCTHGHPGCRDVSDVKFEDGLLHINLLHRAGSAAAAAHQQHTE
ncbi:hypothetical protein SSYIS1_26160 [Serratia symbiotica]|uniref:Uncharacterized protein n=1 Tax=Serratia symbiotica TaxID=138074 RepID=A0A455VS33_9GAMM|nr:hypothetical protein SSYIS1_26160 [Serratia symbiotica]